MAIPDYQSIMLPALKSLSNGEGKKLRELVDILVDEFQFTADERKELLPSGQPQRRRQYYYYVCRSTCCKESWLP